MGENKLHCGGYMILKGIIESDTINYRKISMVLEFPKCTFKCDKECGMQVCQNCKLASAPDIEIDDERIIQMYINNPVTEAVVMQGLEPFDSLSEVINFIKKFRKVSNDDIVIYTGYTEEEIFPYLDYLKQFNNIIVKFGRFIPNDKPYYDTLLGVKLASSNQYAKRIS